MKVQLLIFLCFMVHVPVHAQIEDLFSPWNHDHSPGVAVAVQYQGDILFHDGFGMANLEHRIPIKSTSVFDLASLSKQFTAFAISMLIEEESISLNDDIRTYLPEFPDFGHTITIEHLLYHTSGLRDWPQLLELSGRNMQDVISMGEIFSLITHQKDLNFTPGTQYLYSNTGYNLLAMIIEHVSGQSFRSYMEDHIFEPLQMAHTHVQDDHEEVVFSRVTSYQPLANSYFRLGNGLMGLGSSSVHSTTEDLLRWVEHLENQTLGSPDVVALMNQQGILEDGVPIAYGFGLVHGNYRGLKTISHSGAWAGFRTALLHFPDHEYTVIILGNDASMNATDLAYQVAEFHLGVFMSSESNSTVPSGHFTPDDYAGIYDFSPSLLLQLTIEDSSLIAILPPHSGAPVEVTGKDSLSIDILDEPILFTRDSTGTVTHASTHNFESERSPFSKEIPPPAILEGCYMSQELATSYIIEIQDDTLVATGPRGQQHTLKRAFETVYTSNSWTMPVVRFFQDPPSQTISHLEINSPRNYNVRFERGC